MHQQRENYFIFHTIQLLINHFGQHYFPSKLVCTLYRGSWLRYLYYEVTISHVLLHNKLEPHYNFIQWHILSMSLIISNTLLKRHLFSPIDFKDWLVYCFFLITFPLLVKILRQMKNMWRMEIEHCLGMKHPDQPRVLFFQNPKPY